MKFAGISDGMKNEWQQTFSSHVQKLKKAKTKAENIRDGKSDDVDDLKAGSTALAEYKKDRRVYDVLVRACKAQESRKPT